MSFYALKIHPGQLLIVLPIQCVFLLSMFFYPLEIKHSMYCGIATFLDKIILENIRFLRLRDF